MFVPQNHQMNNAFAAEPSCSAWCQDMLQFALSCCTRSFICSAISGCCWTLRNSQHCGSVGRSQHGMKQCLLYLVTILMPIACALHINAASSMSASEHYLYWGKVHSRCQQQKAVLVWHESCLDASFVAAIALLHASCRIHILEQKVISRSSLSQELESVQGCSACYREYQICCSPAAAYLPASFHHLNSGYGNGNHRHLLCYTGMRPT